MTPTIKSVALAAALLAGLPAFALAQDAHHPAEAAPPKAPAAVAQAGMPTMPMMGQGTMGGSTMGGGTMGQAMMGQGMMGQGMGGGMAGMGMHGMEMTERVEGRIAFLRAELNIAEAQTKAWNDFAQALRENGRKLGEARPMAMGTGQPGGAPPVTLVQRLEQQERWYAARLSGMQAIKATLAGLYGVLSDDQKKTADELMAPHLGMMPMGMPAN